ncbi:hypothetical protein FG386_000883 [Cryptosporidium ryanae]|uniref:uncharacterized protein n=1 Tax=Cryptosporidium ryanae TaxID=515981 RepID=UPI003519D975|nr:hypothetical protein FG386_000883 [Cryptosporidium ryanae]
MGFNIEHDSKAVPWYDSREFFEVFSWLSNSELGSKYMALNRLRVWEERNHGITKQCPISVISTIHILYVMLQDNIWDWNLISDRFNELSLNCGENTLDSFSKLNKSIEVLEGFGKELHTYILINDKILSLRKQYSLAIIRVVNLFADQCQSKTYARSISTIASEIGIPQILVEIRHQSTHGSELPSIEVCRIGAISTLFYLFFNYWKKQHKILLNSIISSNRKIIIHIRRLILIISNLRFSSCVHENKSEELNNIEYINFDLINEIDRFSELFHNALTRTSLEFISTNIRIRNKVLNYFKELNLTGNSNEKKIADEMLNILTDFKGSKNNTFIKTKILKKFTLKLYNNLPKFYNEIWQILNIIRSTCIDEKIIKCFVTDEIIKRICPLCCPTAVVAVLKLINNMSNNLKVEILSFLISGIILNNAELENESKKKLHNEYRKKDKTRFFFWLRLLIPNMKRTKTNSIRLKKVKYVIDYDKKRLFEIIMLLTFYKRMDKGDKKLLDYKKILSTIYESQITLFLIFSKMIEFIPKKLLKNGTIQKDIYILNFIKFLKELKCFELTTDLLEGLLKDEKFTYMNNLDLFFNFLKISKKNTNNSNSRGILIENSGMTCLLKTGTYWDEDEFKIYNFLDHTDKNNESENIPLTKGDEAYELEHNGFEVITEVDCVNKCNCLDTKSEIKLLSMYDVNNKITSNYMNNCLLNAEKLNRQSIGRREIMSERALNINWESVVNFSGS